MRKKNSESIKRFILNKYVLICFLCLFINSNIEAQKEFFTLQQTLATVVDSFHTTYKLPGIIVGIWTPDFTFNKTIGDADMNTSTPGFIDDKVRIGSITKTFTATVVLQLVEEGKLRLDDYLNKYYSQIPNSSGITIRQMMNMTSGIADYLDDSTVENSFFYNRLQTYTPQQLLDIIVSMTPVFAPGQSWSYSNSNYLILGMIIEKITGNQAGDEITSRIINKLNLANTSVPLTPSMSGQYRHGYMVKDTAGNIEDVSELSPTMTSTAGYIISNIDDLKIWAPALANGTLLSKAMQDQRLTYVGTGQYDYLKYGLGILYIDGFVGHNGAVTGYNSAMYYYPDENATFIVFVNEYGPNEKISDIADVIFGVLAKRVFPEKNLFTQN